MPVVHLRAGQNNSYLSAPVYFTVEGADIYTSLDFVEHLSWEEVAAQDIRRDGSNILVGELKFIVKGKDARQLLELLKSIQALYTE